MRYVYDITTGSVTEEEDATPAYTKEQLMAMDIAATTAQYKSDTQQLQLNWLTAIVNDGTTEETKKAKVISDISALRTKYAADVAAIKSKYA